MRVALIIVPLLLLASSPAVSQVPPPDPHLLFSPNGACHSDGTGCWAWFQTYHVFIELQDVTDAVGVSFRLESDTFGPEDFAAIIPHEDVTMIGNDLFAGVQLVWPQGTYVSDTLLTVPISLQDPYNDGWSPATTVDVEVYRANGEVLQLPNGPFYCSHCTMGGYGWVYWLHPDTLTVPVGVDTVLAIKNRTAGQGMTGSGIDALDTAGWITGCTHCGLWVQCGGCPWDYGYVLVDLYIPPDAGGSYSTVTLTPTGPCCTGDPTSFVVYALAPVAVETKTWGEIKALMRRR